MKKLWIVLIMVLVLVGCRNGVNPPEMPTVPDYEITVEVSEGKEVIDLALQTLADLGGGTITLSEGTFVIDGPINLISNMVIQGQGANTIIKLADMFDDHIDVIGGYEVSNVTIRNLVIDGNKANQPGAIPAKNHIGIAFRYSNNITVENVIVKNCKNSGIYFYHVTNGKIINNTCQENRDGIRLEFVSNGKITNNTCQKNDSYGIYTHYCPDGIVAENMSQENGEGIYLSQSSNNTITNNTCQINSARGIHLHNSSNNIIMNNTCQGNSQADSDQYDNIYLRTVSNYNNIQNNTCRKGNETNKPRYGIRINSSDCDGNIVTNNDLYDSGISGSFSDLGTGTITTLPQGNRL